MKDVDIEELANYLTEMKNELNKIHDQSVLISSQLKASTELKESYKKYNEMVEKFEAKMDSLFPSVNS